ncbi:hypothetical protein Tco_0984273 [Tanacetum coccineum]
MLKGRNLMEDTDNKLDIALDVNSDDEELKNIIEKRNEFFVTLYKDVNKKVEEDDEDKDRDLEKDDDDEETDGDDDDDETDRDNDDKDDDDKDENNDKNYDDNETDGDNEDETDRDNDEIEDDDDENNENDENSENIRRCNKEEGGSENVKDDNVEEVITDVEQKDENVEEEKKRSGQSRDFELFFRNELEDFEPLTLSQETGKKYSNKRRKLPVFDDVSILNTQLESKKISDPSLVVHQMIEDMTKLPFISGALKEAAHDKIDDVPCSEENGSVIAVEVPHQKVINAAKDKTVQVTKKEVPKKINAKVTVKRSAKAVDVPPDKVVDAAKKKLAAMTQFKQPRPATKIIKDDYQTPKRGRKRVAQVLEEDLVLSGKRMVNPSFALVSPYFERKTMYTKPFTVAEKKIVEYIWSYNSPEGDIIFTGKGLQIECIWFFSLYPEIQLSSNIIDLWSTILNDEEKYRGKQSVTKNIYCSTGMLDLNCDALGCMKK